MSQQTTPSTRPSRRAFIQLLGLSGASAALAACQGVLPAMPAARPPDSDVLYVSPKGNDAWSGTLAEPNLLNTDGPFATLTRARDAIRERLARKVATPPRVYIRGGRYVLSAPLEFTPADTATPITYAAYPGETPIFDGGQRIPKEQWKVETVRGLQMWVAEMPSVKSGQWYFRQLFINGERRPRARLPKVGPAPAQRKFLYIKGRSSGQDYFSGASEFQVGLRDIDPNWRNLQDAEVVILHYWVEDRLPITSYDHATQRVKSSRQSVMTIKSSNWFYIDNVFEALTEPGEWYLDRQEGNLYYLPKVGETLDSAEIYAPRLEQVLKLTGNPTQGAFVEFLRFDGLTFEHTEYSPPPDRAGAYSVQAASSAPGAIQMVGARHCVIENCTIRNIGLYGIELGEGCRDNRISHNELFDLGAGGVKMNGANIVDDAQAPKLTGNNQITDNEIHSAGNVFHSAVGILSMNGAGNDISHNHIHDLYYTGISCGWVWGYGPSASFGNRIEKNHIHDIGRGWISDMGGIYMLGMQPGTILRGNLIHDVQCADNGYGGWGIYLDEGSSFVLVQDNVCHSMTSQPFHQHYGRQNVIRNNMFAFGREGQARLSRPEGNDLAFTFERNIAITKGMPIFSDSNSGSSYAINILSDYNLFWDVSGKSTKPASLGNDTLERWQQTGRDQHSLVADPRVKDLKAFDFTLDKSSPAFGLGFHPIDLSDVGPRPI